jgi:hypothetical protein
MAATPPAGHGLDLDDQPHLPGPPREVAHPAVCRGTGRRLGTNAAWLQPVTVFNPIRHFGVITRGAMIKGSTLEDLWPNFLALGAPLRLRVENELGFKMVKRRIRWKWA